MGMPQSRGEWVEAAAEEIRALLTAHHAVVRPELFARLSERYFQPDDSRFNIDPHIVGLGLDVLEESGDVVEVKERTRGRREVAALRLTNPLPGAETTVESNMARKRLLYARYLSWAQGSTRHPHGLIGPAAESAVRTCLTEAASIALAAPGGAETRTLLGVTLSGALDAAGYIITLDPQGLPTPPSTLLVEVKNLRQWIYPEDAELWQLLGKALSISRQHPNHPVVPVLVCRRAHPSSRWMAKQLGFMIIEMLANFAGSVSDQVRFDEVRNGLQFHDLKIGTEPNKHMRKQLSEVLPRHASTIADRWRQTTGRSDMVGLIAQLSNRQVKAPKRRNLVQDLDQAAVRYGLRGWRRHS